MKHYVNHEEAIIHQLSSKHHRSGLGDLDESDVGVGYTLANEVVDAVAASPAVTRECSGSDVCNAIRLLARSIYSYYRHQDNMRVQEHLLIADLLLQQQTAAVTLERKAHEAILAAGVVLVVHDWLGRCAARKVQGAVVCRLDVELDVVEVLSFGLAAVELRDLPDVVAFCGNGAWGSGLAGLEGCGESSAGEGEERGDGGELHSGGCLVCVLEGW
jgi:hypothetical protein